jgi:NitT/TauT family transport system substrate-binding protein
VSRSRFFLTLAIVIVTSLGLPAQRPDRRLAVAVNTATIEGAPVYVAETAATANFTLINGGVRNLADPGVIAATNSETQMLLASIANPRIRLLFTVAEGLYRVIARRSAGINRLADLRGKTVTTARETSAQYYLFKMLRTAGLQESDVTFVDVDRTKMADAVAERRADVISMWEPESQKALDSLGADARAFEDTRLYRERFSLYSTTDVLADATKRQELIVFVRAVLTATDTVRKDPRRAIPIVAAKIGQPEAVVAAAWPRHRFPAALPPEMLDVVTEEERWVAGLQKRAPRTRDQLAGFIDPTVLREAQRTVGRTQ